VVWSDFVTDGHVEVVRFLAEVDHDRRPVVSIGTQPVDRRLEPMEAPRMADDRLFTRAAQALRPGHRDARNLLITWCIRHSAYPLLFLGLIGSYATTGGRARSSGTIAVSSSASSPRRSPDCCWPSSRASSPARTASAWCSGSLESEIATSTRALASAVGLRGRWTCARPASLSERCDGPITCVKRRCSASLGRVGGGGRSTRHSTWRGSCSRSSSASPSSSGPVDHGGVRASPTACAVLARLPQSAGRRTRWEASRAGRSGMHGGGAG
jgi:hypothetical protein